MNGGSHHWVSVVFVSLLMLGGSYEAHANVNLEWRPAAQTVHVGDTVHVGLYALSDDDTDQPFLAVQVIMVWNPADLLGVTQVNSGPFPWPASGFPDDSAGDGLNLTGLDGDAYYTNSMPLEMRTHKGGIEFVWAIGQGQSLMGLVG